MIKNEKISVVVPIYNVEEYLPRCLDSIIEQTYTNIEIMLVDDGSPDNAGAICDEYAARDSRIRVFHIPNGGVAKARQLGVESSTGEYIVFVDPDDWLPLDSVAVLYSNMSEDVDLVVGSIKINDDYIANAQLQNERINSSKYIKKILSRSSLLYGSPWCKLYKRNLFTIDSFPQVKRSQDWLMNVELCMRMRYVKTISSVVYNYIIYDNSVSHKSFPDSKYWENYTIIIYDILQKNGKFTINEFDFYRSNLMIIFESIMNKSYLSISDKWVGDTYSYLINQTLSFKEKLIITSLINRFAQQLLQFVVSVLRKYK